jgi:hypothetical protein
MDRQARTHDTMFVTSREMTGRSQTLPLRLEGRGVKTTENKIHWPRRFRAVYLKGIGFVHVTVE